MQRKNTMSWWLKRNIRKGDLEQVKKITAKHTDAAYLNAKDKNGNSALLFAAKHQCYEILQHLLSIQAIDLNAENNQNETIITLLMGIRDDKTVEIRHQILQNILADKRSKLTGHQSLMFALRWCILHKFNDTARVLIEEHQVNVNCGALALAAKVGNMEMVIRLLACPEIDVMQEPQYGEDALNAALYSFGSGYSRDTGQQIFRRLLEHPRTDVNQTYQRQISYDRYKVALLELASRSDPYEEDQPSKNTLAMLAHRKLDQRWINRMNHPVLTWAKTILPPDLFQDLPIHIKQNNVWGYEYNGWNVSCDAKSLLDFFVNDGRFNINTRLWDGSTLLIRAIKSKDQTLIDAVLLNQDCDVLAQDSNGETALITASATGNKALENKFISGITFGQAYAENRNIVMLAADFGQTALVERLLELAPADFDINERDAHGDTALSLAVAKHDNAKLTRVLLSAGADPYALNLDGRDAVMIANDNRYFGLGSMMAREPHHAASLSPDASAATASAVGLFSSVNTRLTLGGDAPEYKEPPQLKY